MSPLKKINHPEYWPRRQQGAVMVLVVIALLAILLMGALALDGSHMLLNKTRLQNAVDAAALSGAKELQTSFGGGNASTLARSAALDTLARNAAAVGNAELGKAIGTSAAAVAGHTQVTFARSVYGPFSFPGPADAKYVRVSVPSYPLTGFLWRVAQVFGGVGDKAVAAIATAGPSPSAGPCRIEPILVCGDPNANPANNGGTSFWGYRYGDLKVLKSAAGNDPVIGPGNFQMLRLDGAKGADDLRNALAGGIEKCNVVGDKAATEPGNSVGPVAQGLNTRFGEYHGPGMNPTDYPPDWVIQFSSPNMTYDSSTGQVLYKGQQVKSADGNLTAGGESIYDINDWKTASASCAISGSCSGTYERRMLNIVIGNCTGKSGGQVDVPVLDFGCFFMLQTVEQNGSEAQVFGQFARECEGDGVAGALPSEDVGPVIIQLYKSYIDDNRTPSTDS